MDRPNILIVMTDHQRADTVLPENQAITPNLDKFGKEGVIFTHSFCPSPHCCPSRATFHSGLYPSRHGVWNNVCNGQALRHGLNENIKLWSEDLSENGYDLHFYGKWHVSIETHPKDHGWIQHKFGPHGRNDGKDWDRYRNVAASKDEEKRNDGEIIRPGYGKDHLYGNLDPENDPQRWIFEEPRDLVYDLAGNKKPWCLFTSTNMPHDPYEVPQKYLDMYKIDDINLPDSFSDDFKDKPNIYKRMRDMRFGQLTELETRKAIMHYLALCTYLDDQFGEILEVLEKTGQADNTLVLYCSDHGDYCGEHGLFAKGIPCFNSAYNVPSVIRWPNGVKNPGRRVNEFVSLADFGPTFLELTNTKVDRYFTGKSLVPFLKDEKPENWRDTIFSQCNGVELYFSQRSAMTKEFKYVFNGFDFDELYDLENDPHQMINLADNPEYENIKKELCRRMWRFAYEENDSMINNYITVALAPYGPAIAFDNS